MDPLLKQDLASSSRKASTIHPHPRRPALHPSSSESPLPEPHMTHADIILEASFQGYSKSLACPLSCTPPSCSTRGSDAKSGTSIVAVDRRCSPQAVIVAQERRGGQPPVLWGGQERGGGRFPLAPSGVVVNGRMGEQKQVSSLVEKKRRSATGWNREGGSGF